MSRLRILVTGARGQLGSEVMGVLAAGGHEAVGAGLPECDLAAEGAAARMLELHRPDAVINCAAWTKVDAAETQVEEAERANVLLPALLAGACAAVDVPLLHVSTDFVFNGEATRPIPEEAVPEPLSVYGRTKLAGEEVVRQLCPQHVIVRTSWLYGGRGPNFVLTMLELAAERDVVRVVDDQTGGPTWTGHLAPALSRLIEAGRRGTYHLSNGGQASWCGFARAIFVHAGRAARAQPITTAQYPTPARRPRFSVLDNRAWRRDGEEPLPGWEVGLRTYLERLSTRPTLSVPGQTDSAE